jgi:protein SCO1/2
VLHHADRIELKDDIAAPIAIGSSPNRTIVVLGFTRCTDQCPLTLARVALALAEAPSRNRPRAFFVTVDPAHDDPVTLHRYLRTWSNRITGITGTREALRRFYLSLGSVDLGSRYPDHDSRIFVLNSDGDVEQNLYPESSADEIRHALLD